MPPKKRNYNTRSTKPSDKDQPKLSKIKKRNENEARDQARKHNQSFLQDALISAKTECSEDVYSQSGHVFVSVPAALTSTVGGSFRQDIFGDPLDLSQRSTLSQEQHQQNEVANAVTFEENRENSTTSQAQQLPEKQPSPAPRSTQIHMQSALKASTVTPRLSQRSPQSPPTLSTDDPLEGCSQNKNYVQPSTQPPHKEPHSKLPSARSLQNQLMLIPMDDPQEGCSHNYETDDNSDCDIDNSADTPNDEKYTKLDKYRKQSKSLSNLRKKYDALKHNFAEMKDVVVYATTEAKKAKADPNANRTFTLDPDVNITVETLEKINLMSKSAGNFAQNLCLYLYGAENLRQKSVTGQPSNRLKGAPATRPGITPTKLQFIYNKARERVALEKGVNNHAQIASLANETIINRAIAEKNANLNKAVKYAALRDQERSSSTSNSVS